ncbi:GNAT family N-acetyltransferase [Nocardia tengchongensis]|uniref:GNAT family N-acetyltransferase n=1 Tax=Nocardia tengchongensis TaxID=2055889 RepID=UPI003688E3B3
MTAQIRLGPAGPEHVPWLVEVESEPSGRVFLGHIGADYHHRWLLDPDIEQVIGVTEDQEPAGFVVLAGLHSPDRSIEVRRIVLAADFRGRGLGRALLRAALEHSEQTHRASRVWLDVKPENATARNLYDSEGFTSFGSTPDPLDPSQALILMERLANTPRTPDENGLTHARETSHPGPGQSRA